MTVEAGAYVMLTAIKKSQWEPGRGNALKLVWTLRTWQQSVSQAEKKERVFTLQICRATINPSKIDLVSLICSGQLYR